ncbi:hypothetical protein HCEG_06656 [Histoplasma capsulatum var. duboisii H88]|uniref:Uncharacterized protein n=1 Tax=Ajellomyces capsulatus (strain H88) TaxID=544711 RepID=F0UMX4_AJEC8|nr:hypothetical protein HCEG_06656 [Histoplasma capsulatum var. duboisii H88]
MSMSMSMDDALRVKKLKEEKQMRLSRFCVPKEKQEDFYRYLESLKIKKMPQAAGITEKDSQVMAMARRRSQYEIPCPKNGRENIWARPNLRSRVRRKIFLKPREMVNLYQDAIASGSFDNLLRYLDQAADSAALI